MIVDRNGVACSVDHEDVHDWDGLHPADAPHLEYTYRLVRPKREIVAYVVRYGKTHRHGGYMRNSRDFLALRVFAARWTPDERGLAEGAARAHGGRVVALVRPVPTVKL